VGEGNCKRPEVDDSCWPRAFGEVASKLWVGLEEFSELSWVVYEEAGGE